MQTFAEFCHFNNQPMDHSHYISSELLSLETINPDLKVISLNGTTNIKRLLLLAKENNYKGSFIIALDNDSVGKTTSELLKLQLNIFDT